MNSTLDIDRSKNIIDSVLQNVKTVIVGKDKQIQSALSCWLAGGHLLIQDLPGTGKTILARALAGSVQVDFRRIQFTPDLLPGDIIGSSIYRQDQAKFEFISGPLFTTVLLADEINRATPRTQSALLEAMSEGQVSAEGVTTSLKNLFFTIATQNPLDQLGTFSLPEAQLDRFMMRISLGYPQATEEISILKQQNQDHPIKKLQPVQTEATWQWVKDQIPQIIVSDEILDYILKIVSKTRNWHDLKVGASPRASLALKRAAQAKALVEGLTYVSPTHVYELVHEVLGHRLIPTIEAKLAEKSVLQILDEIRAQVPVPVKRK